MRDSTTSDSKYEVEGRLAVSRHDVADRLAHMHTDNGQRHNRGWLWGTYPGASRSASGLRRRPVRVGRAAPLRRCPGRPGEFGDCSSSVAVVRTPTCQVVADTAVCGQGRAAGIVVCWIPGDRRSRGTQAGSDLLSPRPIFSSRSRSSPGERSRPTRPSPAYISRAPACEQPIEEESTDLAAPT